MAHRQRRQAGTGGPLRHGVGMPLDPVFLGGAARGNCLYVTKVIYVCYICVIYVCYIRVLYMF